MFSQHLQHAQHTFNNAHRNASFLHCLLQKPPVFCGRTNIWPGAVSHIDYIQNQGWN